ncbi:hypothetical protein [Candidatus Poriferisocius sp.]|uniref:hypothetical protein n=1 Tax=Candidatus Poriferisocius sp. TaxID=3101276 RepID=UPI003B022336
MTAEGLATALGQYPYVAARLSATATKGHVLTLTADWLRDIVRLLTGYAEDQL